MTTPVDLDALEKLHAEATWGPWTHHADTGFVTSDGGFVVHESPDESDEDALAIAATHNALPALIAELRALREVAEAAELARDVLRFDLRKMLTFGPDYNQAVKDAADRLTTALAKVPR